MSTSHAVGTAPVLTMKGKALVILDKVAWTFAYQFVTVLFAAGTVGLYAGQSYARALDSAAFTAIITLVTALILVLGNVTAKVRGVAAVAIPIVLTFLQSALGTMSADTFTHSVVHTDWKGAFAVAFVATLPSAIKVFLSHANVNTIGTTAVLAHSDLVQG